MDEGGGAFYGPKVELPFPRRHRAAWQLTTVQCDFAFPQRFDLDYAGDDNDRHRPVMIHRAIFGIGRAVLRRADRALRRRLPAVARARARPAGRRSPTGTWTTRTPRGDAPCRAAAGRRRLEGDGRKKIRAAQLMKAPYMLVIGDREIEAGTFTVRDRAGNETRGVTFGEVVPALTTRSRPARSTQSSFGG